MQIKKFNIAKAKKYLDKQGQEKTQWNTVGTMTVFQKDDGTTSRILEIPAIGLEASIFPVEPKPTTEYAKQTPQYQAQQPQQPEAKTEIQVSDIPF